MSNNVYIKATTPSDKWVRPSDWLPIDSLVSVGQDKWVMLIAIFPNRPNRLGIRCGFNYTVNWGDGNTNNYSLNTTNTHDYDFASSSNLTTEGFKQAIVTITPTSGTMNGLVWVDQGVWNLPALDIRISSQFITSFQISTNTRAPYLKKFVWLGTHTTLSLNNMFINADVEHFDMDLSNLTGLANTFTPCSGRIFPTTVNITSNTPTFSSTFQSTDIRNVGNITLNSVANLQQSFLSAQSLLTVGNISATIATQINTLFSACYRLRSVGTINVPAITTATNTFSNCMSLETLGTITTSSSFTNAQNMFNGCYSLKGIHITECTNITTTTSMFLSCFALENLRVPNIKTTFSVTNTSLGQTALVTLFNDLATVVGQTLTITNTPGASLLTAPERAIATGKGWTLVG